MKLSEAIRLGEFTLPAKHGVWIFREKDGTPCGACAVGRACIAAGYQYPGRKEDLVGTLKVEANGIINRDSLPIYVMPRELHGLSFFMSETWPWTRNIYGSENKILKELSFRYEQLEHSMTELADWIETIEPQEVNDSSPELCHTTAWPQDPVTR